MFGQLCCSPGQIAYILHHLLIASKKNGGRQWGPTTVMKASLRKRDVSLKVSADWETRQNLYLHLLCVRAILADRHLPDISSCCFTHLKGGWVAGEQRWYHSWADGDQEAAASNCYCTCHMSNWLWNQSMQTWESSPVGRDEVHWICRENPSSFSSEVERIQFTLEIRHCTQGVAVEPRSFGLWLLYVIIFWKTWYAQQKQSFLRNLWVDFLCASILKD